MDQGGAATKLHRMVQTFVIFVCCSNVLPEDVDAGRDFFTESSPGAVRGMLASWPVDDCRAW